MFWHRSQLARIEAKLDRLLKEDTLMSASFQDLITQIQHNADVEDSALQAINGLLTRIAALVASGASPEQIQAEIDLAKQHADALAAAVAAIPPTP